MVALEGGGILCSCGLPDQLSALVTDSNQPLPLWQDPATVCLTASEAPPEAPSLAMHRRAFCRQVARARMSIAHLTTSNRSNPSMRNQNGTCHYLETR